MLFEIKHSSGFYPVERDTLDPYQNLRNREIDQYCPGWPYEPAGGFNENGDGLNEDGEVMKCPIVQSYGSNTHRLT